MKLDERKAARTSAVAGVLALAAVFAGCSDRGPADAPEVSARDGQRLAVSSATNIAAAGTCNGASTCACADTSAGGIDGSGACSVDSDCGGGACNDVSPETHGSCNGSAGCVCAYGTNPPGIDGVGGCTVDADCGVDGICEAGGGASPYDFGSVATAQLGARATPPSGGGPSAPVTAISADASAEDPCPTACGIPNVRLCTPGDKCKPYKAPKVGGFKGDPTLCYVTKDNTVYRWGKTSTISFGNWGGWTSPKDYGPPPPASAAKTIRSALAVCASWNDLSDEFKVTLSAGSNIACGPGAPVSKADCNATKACKQDADGWKGGDTQIAVTNFVGTSKNVFHQAPGLDVCE